MSNTAVLVVGGGAAGFVTGAYLHAIEDSEIEVNQIHGTSSGAINAGAYLSGGGKILQKMWATIKNKDVYKDNLLTWIGLAGKKASCYDSSPLFNLLTKTIDPGVIRAAKQTLYVSVTDVEQERALSINLSTIKTDDAARWIYASASPPVFFSQVEIDGRQYVDGGLGENLGLINAIRNGADKVIIMCPRKITKATVLKNGMDAIKFSIRMPLNYMIEKELKVVEIMNGVEGKRHIDTLLIRPSDDCPDLPEILNFDGLGSFSERAKLWDIHEAEALNALTKFFA